MSAWEKLLERPQAGSHFVQLYESGEDALANNAGHYLWEGLRHGEGVLVIATPEHEELFSTYLGAMGADVSRLIRERQLVFTNAQQTLSRFMASGQPDWTEFERVIRTAIRQVQPRRDAGLRAYGEMVGILWKARQFAAAIRLEQLWNKLLEQSAFSLYCAYAIDVFGEEFNTANLDGVLCTHTHLVPAELNGGLETALNNAMEEILGGRAKALGLLIKADYRPEWAVIPTAERTVLWLRKNLPEEADVIMKSARHHYRQLTGTLVAGAGGNHEIVQ